MKLFICLFGSGVNDAMFLIYIYKNFGRRFPSSTSDVITILSLVLWIRTPWAKVSDIVRRVPNKLTIVERRCNFHGILDDFFRLEININPWFNGIVDKSWYTHSGCVKI